ncbi:MAG: TatD family hydrolase [Chloroflexi bacterium]|nr:TatD family hydrolase [Chloroflexota bacterium]
MGRGGPWARHRHAQPNLPAHRAGGAGLSKARRPSSLPGIVDSHCHLQHERFELDRDAVLARAAEAGIERILVPGWDLPSSYAALELASRHGPQVEAAVGVHPHHAAETDDAGWDELERLAADDRCRAVGEIGLDYFRNLSPPDVQRDAFARQLALAAGLDRPVLVHDRDAHDEVTASLEAWIGPARRPVKGVLHAFSGDAAMAERLTARGFLVSFALPVTFRSAAGPRAAAPTIGDGTFLVETDAPYLGPDRDRRNEPTTVLRVVAELAQLRGQEAEAVAAGVRQAYDRLIGA